MRRARAFKAIADALQPGVDMLQAFVSASCSIMYIASSLTEGVNPTTTGSARVFIGLSIAVSAVTVIVSLCFYI